LKCKRRAIGAPDWQSFAISGSRCARELQTQATRGERRFATVRLGVTKTEREALKKDYIPELSEVRMVRARRSALSSSAKRTHAMS
jgi:hypothetical protein